MHDFDPITTEGRQAASLHLSSPMTMLSVIFFIYDDRTLLKIDRKEETIF